MTKLNYDVALLLFRLQNNFTEEALKKRYKELILYYHPDKNNGTKISKKYSQIINEAYIILQDKTNKKVKKCTDILMDILQDFVYTEDEVLNKIIENVGKKIYEKSFC